MRQAFVQTIIDEAYKNKKLFLITGDLGFTVFEEFRSRFPNQFLNIGVAEQNMIGVATGLALTGKTVICYTIASFATSRPYEQIKIDVASHNASVIIVGTGAGLSYSTASITHQSLDDIALMRLIPGMTIFSPADNIETIWATKTAMHLHSPVYLRISKNETPNIHANNKNFVFGKADILKNGKDIAIISTGILVRNVLKIAELLSQKSINPTIISLHTLKPFDSNLIQRLSNNHGLIVTVEEHSVIGGIGSIVSEIITKYNLKIRLLTIGTPDEFIHSIGSHDYLQKNLKIDPKSITIKILKNLYNNGK